MSDLDPRAESSMSRGGPRAVVPVGALAHVAEVGSVGGPTPTGRVVIIGAPIETVGPPPIRSRVLAGAGHVVLVGLPTLIVALIGYFAIFRQACDQYTFLGETRTDCTQAGTEGWVAVILTVITLLVALIGAVAVPIGMNGSSVVMEWLDLKLVDNQRHRPIGIWRSVLRSVLGLLVSAPLAGLGWWWVLLDRRATSWHDLILDSSIVTSADPEWGSEFKDHGEDQGVTFDG